MTGWQPLVRQRRFYALGAWTQHMLFVALHLMGSLALAAVAVKCPRRYRGVMVPLATVGGALGGFAVFYHWTAANDIQHEIY